MGICPDRCCTAISKEQLRLALLIAARLEALDPLLLRCRHMRSVLHGIQGLHANCMHLLR